MEDGAPVGRQRGADWRQRGADWIGAFSIRRRIDFRIEDKSSRSKIIARIDYPSYGGVLGALLDRMTSRRRLDAALGDSLIHFKGLVEFKTADGEALLDF